MDIIPLSSEWTEQSALLGAVSELTLAKVKDESGSSHFDGPEGWIRGLSNVRLDVDNLPFGIRQAIAELLSNSARPIGELAQVMVNRLDAGGSLAPHRDGLPDRARYHLPVITHKAVTWWDEIEGRVHMQEGRWYGPVRYCGVLHSMSNPSDVERVHVVADFEWANHARH